MRMFCLLIVLLICPAFAQAQTLELPAAIKVQHRPGRLIIVDAKTDAEKGVTWDVVRPLGFELEAIRDEKRITLGMPSPGSTFTVIAAIACKDGKAVVAQCRVEVLKGDGYTMPPDQEPIAPSNVKHATLLVSRESSVEAVAKILEPQLERRGVRLYVLAVADADADFKTLHNQAGDCLVLQDAEGNVIGGNVVRLQLTTDPSRDAADLLRVVEESR